MEIIERTEKKQKIYRVMKVGGNKKIRKEMKKEKKKERKEGTRELNCVKAY